MKQPQILLNSAGQQFVKGQQVTVKTSIPAVSFKYHPGTGTVNCTFKGLVMVTFGKKLDLYAFQPDELDFVDPPPPRLPLATPVRILANGVDAVISELAADDGERYRVSYFDPRARAVRHDWLPRPAFEPQPGRSLA